MYVTIQKRDLDKRISFLSIILQHLMCQRDRRFMKLREQVIEEHKNV